MTIIVCVRDPDYSNEFKIFDGEAEIFDMDLGQRDLTDREEFAEWERDWQRHAVELRRRAQDDAASAIEDVIEQQRENVR